MTYVYVMKKTMVYLEDDLARALKQQARLLGKSSASIIREALRQHLRAKGHRRLSFVATVDGPAEAIGLHADDILCELLK